MAIVEDTLGQKRYASVNGLKKAAEKATTKKVSRYTPYRPKPSGASGGGKQTGGVTSVFDADAMMGNDVRLEKRITAQGAQAAVTKGQTANNQPAPKTTFNPPSIAAFAAESDAYNAQKKYESAEEEVNRARAVLSGYSDENSIYYHSDAAYRLAAKELADYEYTRDMLKAAYEDKDLTYREMNGLMEGSGLDEGRKEAFRNSYYKSGGNQDELIRNLQRAYTEQLNKANNKIRTDLLYGVNNVPKQAAVDRVAERWELEQEKRWSKAIDQASLTIDRANLFPWQKEAAKSALQDLPMDQASELMTQLKTIGAKRLMSGREWNSVMKIILEGDEETAKLEAPSNAPSSIRPYFAGDLSFEKENGIRCSNYFFSDKQFYVKVKAKNKEPVLIKLGTKVPTSVQLSLTHPTEWYIQPDQFFRTFASPSFLIGSAFELAGGNSMVFEADQFQNLFSELNWWDDKKALTKDTITIQAYIIDETFPNGQPKTKHFELEHIY